MEETIQEQTQIDPERQKKAKEYARLSRPLMLVDLAFGAIYIIIWLIPLGGGNLSSALKNSLLGITSNVWLLVLLYALVFGGIYYIINLPLAYYEGFVLPHRYGTSIQSLNGWIVDQLKGLVVGGILGAVLLEVIYAVLRAFPDTWWIWAAAILLLFSVILANLAPVLLMPLFNKFTPLGEEHKELVERLMRLSERAHTKVKGVFKFDMSRRTTAANAALTGIGNTRRIILGDTLINEFTPDEIETVMAHELGHHVHKDLPMGMVEETVMTVVGLFLTSLVLKAGITLFHFQGPGDIAAFPLFVLAMSLYGLITMPLGNAFSRWRERRADEYALETTKNGPAFASAMTRLANQNLAEIDPEPWVEFLLYSHPALNKRIAMAEEYSQTRE